MFNFISRAKKSIPCSDPYLNAKAWLLSQTTKKHSTRLYEKLATSNYISIGFRQDQSALLINHLISTYYSLDNFYQFNTPLAFLHQLKETGSIDLIVYSDKPEEVEPDDWGEEALEELTRIGFVLEVMKNKFLIATADTIETGDFVQKTKVVICEVPVRKVIKTLSIESQQT
jgi:fructosamine-3-kinase